MAPLPHRVSGVWTRLQHDRLQAALERVRRGGKPDGPRADDGHSLFKVAHDSILLER